MSRKRSSLLLALIIAVASISLSAGFSGALEKKTLGDIRKELLGQEVVIMGTKASCTGRDVVHGTGRSLKSTLCLTHIL
jgi:hypothetical protein